MPPKARKSVYVQTSSKKARRPLISQVLECPIPYPNPRHKRLKSRIPEVSNHENDRLNKITSTVQAGGWSRGFRAYLNHTEPTFQVYDSGAKHVPYSFHHASGLFREYELIIQIASRTSQYQELHIHPLVGASCSLAH